MRTLRRFLPYFRYLKPVWWRFALGVFFGVLFSVSSGLGLPVMAETVFPIRRIGIYVAKRSQQLVHLGEALGSSMIESIQSPLEIRAYNLQQAQVQRFVEQFA